jgi:hypothetical protein
MPPYRPRQEVKGDLDRQAQNALDNEHLRAVEKPAHEVANRRAADIMNAQGYDHLKAKETAWVRNIEISSDNETVEYKLEALPGFEGNSLYRLTARVTRPHPVYTASGQTLVGHDTFALLNCPVSFTRGATSQPGVGVAVGDFNRLNYSRLDRIDAADSTGEDFQMVLDTLEFISRALIDLPEIGKIATAQAVSL